MKLVELGAALKREREERGLSMDEIMDATKISRRNLIALEEGDVMSWPHPVYLKGYVRNYAELVGLDPEEFVAVVEAHIDAHMQYVLDAPGAPSAGTAPAAVKSAPAASVQPAPIPAEPAQPASVQAMPVQAKPAGPPAASGPNPAAPGAPEEPLVLRLSSSEPLGQPVQKWQPKSLVVVTLLLLVAVLAGLLYQYLSRQDDESQRPAVTAVAPAPNATAANVAAAPAAAMNATGENATVGSAAAAPNATAVAPQVAAVNATSAAAKTPVAAEEDAPAKAPDIDVSRASTVAGATDAASAPAASGEQVLTFSAKPDAVCWVGVFAGRQVTKFMLRHGESRQVKFKGHARVLLGNGGGVSVSLNGAPYPFAGETGKKAKLEIGPR